MSDVEHRILRARLQIMLAHPFLSSAVARLPLCELDANSPWQTAATDGYYIYWSRAFFNQIDDAEIAGVLAHEVLHVVLGHLDRRGERQPERWNAAIDHATNLLLLGHRFKLPEPNLSDKRYRDMSAEAIYNELPATPVTENIRVRRIGRVASAKAEQSKQKPNEGFDAHIEPGDPRLPTQSNKNRPTSLELGRLKKELVREMRDELNSSSSFGRHGAEIAAAFSRMGQTRMPWCQVLSQFVSGIRRDDYRYLPPSRKHLWRGFYLPSVGVPGPRLIVCAIDTSGSINEQFARRFLTEVHGLRVSAQCRLFVLQCDAKVTKIDAYDSWDSPSDAIGTEKFIGGGGTDFRPVFDLVDKRISPLEGIPDFLVYLTDGYGSFPQRPPGYPVLWLMPEGTSKSVPFGQRVEMF